MDTQTIIEIQNLVKQYGSITAVDNLNLSISKGEIFGLLGPNGAGKTTTILMLMGLCEPTSGSISVAGLNPTREPILVKKIVGYMPDSIGFYGDMTGRENLYYTANLNRIPKGEQEKIIDALLAKVGLKDAADRKVREYSRGMRRRLGIADVLLKDPEVVFLDEPTLGLDPEGTAELLEIIKGLGKEEGKTVLISSHLLHQVQAICDRVGIFVRGKLAASGTISELAQKIGGKRAIEIKATPLKNFPYDVISAMPGVDSLSVQDDMVVVDGAGEELAPKIVKALVECGMNIYHVKIRGSDLDDIYRRYFQEEGAKNDK